MMHSITTNKHRHIKKIAIVLFWLAIWQMIYMLVNEEILVVSPLAVLINIIRLVFQKDFWYIIFVTVSRILAGFTISIVVGSVVAFLSYKFKIIFEIINPLFSILKAIPVASFIILAFFWIKSPQIPILICFVMVVPIVFTNVYEGLLNINIELIQMGKVFKLSKLSTLIYITIPSVFPYFLASVKNGIGLAWKSGIAAEVISYPKYGIGSNIYNSKIYLDTLGLFSWTVVVIILSLFFEFVIVTSIDKWIIKFANTNTNSMLKNG